MVVVVDAVIMLSATDSLLVELEESDRLLFELENMLEDFLGPSEALEGK